ASGTTEALRLAEALWRGGDRERARLLLAGYARHAATDQGIWLIRNYFNFATRAFATNSFLVDYDPDFLAEVARAEPDGPWADLATRSAALVGRAATEAGLLYDVVQPELRTLTPGLDLAVFSPNDVVQLANAATVAERAIATRPEVALPVLRFAMERWPHLS